MRSILIKFVESLRDERREHEKLIKETRIYGNVMSSLKLQIGLKIQYFLCLVAVYSFHCMFYSINLSSLISEPYFHREDWDSFMLNIQPAECLEWEVSDFYLAAIRTQNDSLWLHVYTG